MKGTVTDEAIYEKDKAAYKVMSDDIKYDVVSSGKQAMKDLIFIRKGQEIEIQGNLEGEMIQAEKSKISISTSIIHYFLWYSVKITTEL